jgi:hypothetical protein
LNIIEAFNIALGEQVLIEWEVEHLLAIDGDLDVFIGPLESIVVEVRRKIGRIGINRMAGKIKSLFGNCALISILPYLKLTDFTDLSLAIWIGLMMFPLPVLLSHPENWLEVYSSVVEDPQRLRAPLFKVSSPILSAQKVGCKKLTPSSTKELVILLM